MPRITYCRALLYALLVSSFSESLTNCWSLSLIVCWLCGSAGFDCLACPLHQNIIGQLRYLSFSRSDVLAWQFSVRTVVELLVASCLGVLFSIWLWVTWFWFILDIWHLYSLTTILSRYRNGVIHFGSELAALIILWIMFLIGAAIISVSRCVV